MQLASVSYEDLRDSPQPTSSLSMAPISPSPRATLGLLQTMGLWAQVGKPTPWQSFRIGKETLALQIWG